MQNKNKIQNTMFITDTDICSEVKSILSSTEVYNNLKHLSNRTPLVHALPSFDLGFMDSIDKSNLEFC